MEETHTVLSETSFSRKSEDKIANISSYPSIHDSVKVIRNNVSTRILAKPPVVGQQSTRSSSAPSSESLYDESSDCTSSTSVSPIPLSSNTIVVDKGEESCNRNPTYMNLTESTKAKQKGCRHVMEDQFHMLSMPLSNGDAKGSAGSNPSFKVCRDLYPPIPLGRHDELRNRRH